LEGTASSVPSLPPPPATLKSRTRWLVRPPPDFDLHTGTLKDSVLAKEADPAQTWQGWAKE